MDCSVGPDLIERYYVASDNRDTARDILLRSSARRYKVEDDPFRDLLLVANQKYSDAFVAWVNHRASCAACQDAYGRDDEAQFASV